MDGSYVVLVVPSVFHLLTLIVFLPAGKVENSLTTPFKFMRVRSRKPGEVTWFGNSLYSVGISQALGDLAIATSSGIQHAINTGL